ncbi:hypothetical protein FNV43_RR20814 [Rhamnella rubrinervis]|uniref:Uncharacterized protein n=1 Tax=Rhamnella rubrinervis TaxID=2594499 RepID=A0A8K0GUX0_9ROSA|nr:hypothetical protein FNV43_RR20814 [Rhamnella rubrinervis]
MADSPITLDNVKAFLNSQYYDEEKWALNMVPSVFLWKFNACFYVNLHGNFVALIGISVSN